MNSRGWERRWHSGVLLAAICLLAAACGTTPTTGVARAPTLTLVARATLSPTAGPPPALCGADGGSPVTASDAGPNDLIHALRFAQLPDDWTPTPHVLPTATQSPEITIGNGVLLAIPVSVGAATQPGTICGVTVRIASFQPLPGPLRNVYHPCAGQVYLDPGGFHPATACPAFMAPTGAGGVTLPSSSAGSAATFSISGFQGGVADPDHPARIAPDAPNQPRASVSVFVTVPAAGTYTFAIGLWQDRSGPRVTTPDVTQMLLFHQALHEWGGAACTTAEMQALLPPPTNPPTQLICPGPPPQ